jgi:hypothetical protein
MKNLSLALASIGLVGVGFASAMIIYDQFEDSTVTAQQTLSQPEQTLIAQASSGPSGMLCPPRGWSTTGRDRSSGCPPSTRLQKKPFGNVFAVDVVLGNLGDGFVHGQVVVARGDDQIHLLIRPFSSTL